MNKEIVIRDLRKKEKFQIDDEYLNGYAKLCGVYATGVYVCLCRHADYHTQECFPSIEMMAEKLNVSTDSIKRGITKLSEWGIIIKERTRHPSKKNWVNNSYVLLDKSVWKPKPLSSHGAITSVGATVLSASSHSAIGTKSHSAVAASKESHTEKESHTKDSDVTSRAIVSVIDSFKEVNPAYHRWYGNKTQRKAIVNLLTLHGDEKLKKVIAFLPHSNTTPYFPSITTPLQLEEKWAALASAFIRKQNESTKDSLKYPVI